MSAHARAPTVAVAANSAWNLAHFRAPILRALRERGYRVHAVVPAGEDLQPLQSMVDAVHTVHMEPRGLSPVGDLRTLWETYRLFRKLRPNALLAFTAKPNIYGSLAARAAGVPVINTLTGLGTGFLSGSGLKRVMTVLYRAALRRSHRVFFHNDEDRSMFVQMGIVSARQAAVVAGSGVDLSHFAPVEVPDSSGPIKFLFIGRLLRDKGAVEFAEAARIVRRTEAAVFRMVGAVEDHPKAVSATDVATWTREGIVELTGTTGDVRPLIAEADCVVLPSYREGLPRVILEASAMGKPAIVSDAPGCRHAVDDGVTGLICATGSAQSLAEAMTRFIRMSPAQRSAMGRSGRRKAELEFSEEAVVSAYEQALAEINSEAAAVTPDPGRDLRSGSS